MALSRRNILVALGAVVGGGGALVGTGAFSTVAAERTVDVTTAGDDNALLSLSSDSAYLASQSGNTLTIDLTGGSGASGFNENAITTISDIVTITNNATTSAENTSTTVGVSSESPGTDGLSGSGSVTLTINVGTSNSPRYADVTFAVTGSDDSSYGSGSTVSLDSGESAYLDVKIDTTVSPSSPTTDDTLTIVAD